MLSRFQKSFENINIKRLNIVACGSIAITFLADQFYHKIYFPTLLSKLPNIPNPKRINFKTLKHEEAIDNRRDPLLLNWTIKSYLESRDNFSIHTIQLFSLAMLNHYLRKRGEYLWIPCCLLLAGNIIYASAYYLQSLRMTILVNYINDENWKVYENFGNLMFNYQHGAGKLVPIGCCGIFLCILGNAIAWPLCGSIGSILLFIIFFKHWK